MSTKTKTDEPKSRITTVSRETACQVCSVYDRMADFTVLFPYDSKISCCSACLADTVGRADDCWGMI